MIGMSWFAQCMKCFHHLVQDCCILLSCREQEVTVGWRIKGGDL